MKQEFEMTEDQYSRLLNACKPVPAIALNCGMPPSQQENANDAWKALGDELGFKWDTVEPAHGKPPRFFMAERVKGEGK